MFRGDEYVNICNEVDKELREGTYTGKDLFDHCMKTCRRLFDIAEYRIGKPAINIPDEIIDRIGELYDVKYGEIQDEDFPNKKYDYATSWDNFSDDKEISMYDLAMIIDGKTKDKRIRVKNYEGENSADNPLYKEIKKIYREFLPEYFGYKYSDEIPKDSRYEMIRLTKILYECKYSCEIGLGVLKRVSALQFRSDIPSKYQGAINYIKMRMVLRRHDSDFHMSFQTLIRIERFCNAWKSFIYSFPIEAVNSILLLDWTMPVSKRPTYEIIRKVTRDVYEEVLANLTKLNDEIDKELQNIIPAEGVQACSYAKFIEKDIESIYKNYKDDNVGIELSDKVYHATDCICETVLGKQGRAVANIGKYAIENKDRIVRVVFADEIDDGFEKVKRKYCDRIVRHRSYYEILKVLYNFSINQNKMNPISEREAILLICMFEKIDSIGYEIPLYIGSTGERHKYQKIKKLLCKMLTCVDDSGNDRQLTEEEYFFASCWLFESMFMVVRVQSQDDRILMKKLQKELYAYCKRTIPLLVNEEFSVPINLLIEKILPTESRRRILNSIKN